MIWPRMNALRESCILLLLLTSTKIFALRSPCASVNDQVSSIWTPSNSRSVLWSTLFNMIWWVSRISWFHVHPVLIIVCLLCSHRQGTLHETRDRYTCFQRIVRHVEHRATLTSEAETPASAFWLGLDTNGTVSNWYLYSGIKEGVQGGYLFITLHPSYGTNSACNSTYKMQFNSLKYLIGASYQGIRYVLLSLYFSCSSADHFDRNFQKGWPPRCVP